jgi:mannose/cellobiose epimerase-like protein (N-acyl-D-glucosamine 2-epimerase family)
MSDLAGEAAALRRWLFDVALPLWWEVGADRINGGFYEAIDLDGKPLARPHRARSIARQAFAYGEAGRLGWDGPWRDAAQHALDFFARYFVSADGTVASVVDLDGKVLDARFDLYDQAFALLAFASGHRSFGAATPWRPHAVALRTALERDVAHAQGGFREVCAGSLPQRANPHMHLFEAALAWKAISADPAWGALAAEICGIALKHFIDPRTGALAELFDEHWRPLPDATPGQAIEPGHQFEWAWLLLCQDHTPGSPTRKAAERLFEIGENHGVRGGIAINTLGADFRVKDPAARLWPQTERLKAASKLGALTGEERYWNSALGAAQGLWRFLDHGARGLWYDKIDREGKFVAEPAPASSFYHIICAIAEFGEALKQAG